ncbi:serine/threonine protein kinase [Aliidongia dinghuensis]|uniref:Serine/threonine protein kinase n=1 Tax=Aliidongia dinghuensis TaxID=1867774 RepID=A0A8J3E320_9PROT|nr:anti-sigma regulatory factor [Aliidongia dinghuensis]GGF26509.1 serine/threonine protein kinase [Aliidongia dinghuensis]
MPAPAPDAFVVRVAEDVDVVVARQKGREMAQQLGLAGTDLTLIATAISEIARNIVNYAGRGEIRFAPTKAGGRTGIEIVATDEGPGIADIELAMRDGYSTGKSLGLGLPGARRLMDEFAIQSTVGSGTTVTMTKWIK